MAAIVCPDLSSPGFKANPYPFYARLRAEAPVYRAALAGRRAAWLVTRYDDVAALLQDGRFVKSRQNVRGTGGSAGGPWMPAFARPLTRNMLDLDAPDHTRLRALVQGAFTPRTIERLRGRIQALCDGLLDQVQGQGRVELMGAYALPLPITVIAELLGVPPRERGRFHRWSSRLVAVAGPGDLLAALPALWQLVRYLRDLIRQRRADPADDLVTALVRAEQEGDRLSEDELLAMVMLLLTAGHETTVNLIGSGVLALLQHPEQWRRLSGDAALIPAAVEELARFASPVAMATERYAREDVSLHGTVIPAGDLVYAVLASANRDERRFPSPDALDVGREPNRHLAFGLGIHYCLGAPLARLEAQIAIATLLRRLPDLRLAAPAESLRWARGLNLRGLRHLPLAFGPMGRASAGVRAPGAQPSRRGDGDPPAVRREAARAPKE